MMKRTVDKGYAPKKPTHIFNGMIVKAFPLRFE